jgi:hypothetical protein
MSRSILRISLTLFLQAALVAAAQAQEIESLPPVENEYFGDAMECTCPRVETFASLLYLQPGSNNLEYASLVDTLPLLSNQWNNQAITPDMTPAFNVGVRFFLAAPGSDLQISWTHLNTDETATVVAGPNQFVAPVSKIGGPYGDFTVARGEAHYAFDAINLDFGHTLSSDGYYDVRFYGGLQCARISQDLTSALSTGDGISGTIYATDSLFTGVGPRFGMNARRYLGSFSFLGEVSAAAIIGRMHSQMDFTTFSPLLVGGPNRQTLDSPDATQVIPCLDTKLGVGYTFGTNDWGVFRIDAGYMAAIYVNAVSSYALTEQTIVPGLSIDLHSAEHTYSDFTVHGPFMSGSWMY